MKKIIYLVLLLLPLIAIGCSGMSSGTAAPQSTPVVKPAPDKVVIYIYRLANFRGGGRTHTLQIDGRSLGPLTNTNFYRLELWPGKYHLNINLPTETFLGKTSPPMNIGYNLMLTSRDVGKSFVYVYEDGEKIRRKDADPPLLATLQKERSLTTALSYEDTAHVKEFYDTRYEGPEMHGEPHGRGILFWEDGSRYEGVFHYGQLTQEGKFYFPDGRIYMGRLEKARPKGSGVLLSPKGKVLYAGPFTEKKPNGTGIRTGEEGPEYCNFDMGVDVTPSFFDLAEAAVDKDNQMEIKRFDEYWPDPELTDADEIYLEIYKTAYQEFLDELKETRELRKSAEYKKLMDEQQARIDLEHGWCDEQFRQGRKWCICAAFFDNVHQWDACVW